MFGGAIASSSEAKQESGDGELQPYEPGNAAIEESLLIGLGKFQDPFHVEGDCLPEEAKHLLEGFALYRQIQIEADRLPSIVSPESVAVQDTLHWIPLTPRSSSHAITAAPGTRLVDM